MTSATPVPLAARRAMAASGESFATWRKLRQLTVAEVADRADLSAKTIQRLEHGAGASLENTLRVARALPVTYARGGISGSGSRSPWRRTGRISPMIGTGWLYQNWP